MKYCYCYYINQYYYYCCYIFGLNVLSNIEVILSYVLRLSHRSFFSSAAKSRESSANEVTCNDDGYVFL